MPQQTTARTSVAITALRISEKRTFIVKCGSTFGRAGARQRLGVRQSSAAFATLQAKQSLRKRQRTGARQNLAESSRSFQIRRRSLPEANSYQFQCADDGINGLDADERDDDAAN